MTAVAPVPSFLGSNHSTQLGTNHACPGSRGETASRIFAPGTGSTGGNPLHLLVGFLAPAATRPQIAT